MTGRFFFFLTVSFTKKFSFNKLLARNLIIVISYLSLWKQGFSHKTHTDCVRKEGMVIFATIVFMAGFTTHWFFTYFQHSLCTQAYRPVSCLMIVLIPFSSLLSSANIYVYAYVQGPISGAAIAIDSAIGLLWL